jgi:dodecin
VDRSWTNVPSSAERVKSNIYSIIVSGYDNKPKIVDSRKGMTMSHHTYRVIEIVGSSPDGVDAAIRNGIGRAAETTRGLDWFEVQSVRGHLRDGAIGHFQVTMKVGFRLEDA